MSDNNLIDYTFNTTIANVTTLETEIKEKLKVGSEMSQQDLLRVQMDFSRYNNMLSMVSTIAKSLTDTEKSIINKM